MRSRFLLTLIPFPKADRADRVYTLGIATPRRHRRHQVGTPAHPSRGGARGIARVLRPHGGLVAWRAHLGGPEHRLAADRGLGELSHRPARRLVRDPPIRIDDNLTIPLAADSAPGWCATPRRAHLRSAAAAVAVAGACDLARRRRFPRLGARASLVSACDRGQARQRRCRATHQEPAAMTLRRRARGRTTAADPPRAFPGAIELDAETRAQLVKLGPRARPAIAADAPSVPRAPSIHRLLLESSPYLQQHAHNPVNWYRGRRAFETARKLGVRCCSRWLSTCTGAT